MYNLTVSPRVGFAFVAIPALSTLFWGNLKLLDSRNVMTSCVFDFAGLVKMPCLMRTAMFVLYTIEIIMQEWRFWATIFDFEHRAVSRKRPEVCSLGVLLVGGNGGYEQVATNRFKKCTQQGIQHETRQYWQGKFILFAKCWYLKRIIRSFVDVPI